MTDGIITLLIVDDDPIFRLGFCTAIQNFADLQVVGQVDSAAATLELLRMGVPDLIVLGLSIGVSGLELCRTLQNQYPNLPIFLLSASLEPEELIAAGTYGVKGYCPKGTAIETIVMAIRQVASGGIYWEETAIALQSRMAVRRSKWLSRMRYSGLQQIEASLVLVNKQLENTGLPLFDWLFWSGRKRELLAARWIVDQLLPVEVIVVPEKSTPTIAEAEKQEALPPTSVDSLESRLQHKSVSAVLDNTLAKIRSDVINSTGVPLEIDILQIQKRKELLYLVITQLNKNLNELDFLQIQPEEIPERINLILRDLWQSSSIEFISKYYLSELNIERDKLVDIFLQESELVQKYILNKITFGSELIGYFLFEQPLVIEKVLYRSEAPESLARAELLLQNLIINIANGVMQVILNNFSESEIIKENLYIDKFKSSREIARFRNDLSWRYRQEKYFEEPKNIFESKYNLFCLDGKSIRRIYIYAPRTEELNQLEGIPWGMTIALETRDAIAPRLRKAFSFVGSALVYILTQVIGRGIGLIGRGIIQGVGQTLEETRYRKNSERGK